MSKTKRNLIPVLPLRDIVVFPHMIVPIFIGRESSIEAVEQAVTSDDKEILLVLQTDPTTESPKNKKDLHQVGVLANLLQFLRLPDGTIKLLVLGGERRRISSITRRGGSLWAECEPYLEVARFDDELEQAQQQCLYQFDAFIKDSRKVPMQVMEGIMNITDSSKVADTIASFFPLKLSDKQELLSMYDVNDRMNTLLKHIKNHSVINEIDQKIRTRVQQQMEKSQRDYYLNEQIKAIHKELNDGSDSREDIHELELKKEKVKLSKEALEKVNAELKKLKMMHMSSPEAAVVRNYVDWLLSVPWNNPKKVQKNIQKAEVILNEDHFGLEEVKERILEYLSVQSRLGKVKSQILCLVGPPGVGKTSLGKSIARATDRQFVRMSLGGVHDESEIRGHRRTYMGALPGKIVQGMKKSKSSNPLFLLDEIDKLGSDWRGDPASALLEVLDPEQNSTFNDHYLEVDYDLSDVMFITTANSLNMPQPLLDRMEIIRIPGYTETEKMHIVKQYLLSKQLSLNGVSEKEFSITDDAILMIIRRYTKEAGVRNLERTLSTLARKTVRLIDTKKKDHVHITVDNLKDFLKMPRYDYGMIEENDQIGATTGLAWTELGGDILTIEVSTSPGKGMIRITGKLGDVMQESAQAALSYVRSKAFQFGLKASGFEKRDTHIHVPAGATPKDGPSAGIALFTSLVSSYTNIPVRKDVAMTGEITLRGKVLPIGGIKEKILAASRAGIKTVIIPYDNIKDLEEVPDEVKKQLTITPVKMADDVLSIALVDEPKRISVMESDDLELMRKIDLANQNLMTPSGSVGGVMQSTVHLKDAVV